MLNGKAFGSGRRWETVQEYDVTQALRAGKNEILVRARHTAAAAGLIAELTADATRVVTDDSWRCAKTANGEQQGVEKIGSFRDSLWYKHHMGPPKLDGAVAKPAPAAATVAAVEQPKFKPSDLAMTWWKNPDVLPFDVRASEPTPVGWYRFTSPPGLRSMTIIGCRGKVQAWANGKSLSAICREDGVDCYPLSQPTATPVSVLLRIEQARGCYAGAALPEYIQLDCGPGRIALGDWSQNEGLATYSGGAFYRKTVTLTDEQLKASVTLDLGEVAASAEVRINGQLAGTKVAPPWTLEVTKLLKPGENNIEVLVCNTLANHYLTVPTRYRGSPVPRLGKLFAIFSNPWKNPRADFQALESFHE
ncbi:MAG: hypothetical protein NTY53_19775 [Kiritimatiellaeota bacterium]|nr:hypothetical protein [Kiritimatiellota bacterium]